MKLKKKGKKEKNQWKKPNHSWQWASNFLLKICTRTGWESREALLAVNNKPWAVHLHIL